MSYLDILNQYAGFLIVQYHNKTKAIQTVKLFSNSSVCDGLPLALRDCFKLDSAFGNQLTILGKIVGVPRNVLGLDLGHSFFNFTDYSGSPASVGFQDYTTVQPDSYYFLDYNDSFSYVMTDFELLTVIKLAIIQNSGALTYKNIKNKLWGFFAGNIDIVPATDNSGNYFNFTDYDGSPASNGFQDYASQPDISGILFFDYGYYQLMTINYRVKQIYQTAITVAEFLQIVPHPMTVSYNVVIT